MTASNVKKSLVKIFMPSSVCKSNLRNNKKKFLNLNNQAHCYSLYFSIFLLVKYLRVVKCDLVLMKFLKETLIFICLQFVAKVVEYVY